MQLKCITVDESFMVNQAPVHTPSAVARLDNFYVGHLNGTKHSNRFYQPTKGVDVEKEEEEIEELIYIRGRNFKCTFDQNFKLSFYVDLPI